MKQLLLLVIAIVFYCPIIAQIPTNDLIQNATLVDQAPFVENNLRLDLASASAGGQQNCNLNGFQVVYYKFTAANDNEITITIEDTYGNAIGQSFAIVYSAPNLNQTDETQLTGVSTCQYGSVTNFVPTIGVSYYILVHRINGGTLQSKVTIDIPQDASVTERNALIDLYNSAGGTNWTNNNNWTFNDPISSWYGVTVKNGQVTNIDLNSNNLNGTIPASISNLSNLEEVNLSNNSISGTIPDFSLIPTITTVNVNNNNLSFDGLETNYANNNTISSFMYQTQNKTDAQMEFNGTIGNNYNLIMTSVNGTNVQYQWYKKRFNYFVPSDEVINGATSNTLNINNLQGSDMDMYICRATSASIPDLVIERNSIEIKGSVSQTQKDALIALYNSTNGASWTNSTNWLSAQPVSEWHGVTVVGNRVTELNFSGNNLTGTLPPEIGDLTGLEFLSFYSGNNIGGTLPPEMGNLTELRVLSVEYNSFTGSIPASFANLTKLRGFWLFNNMLSGNLPNFVATNYPNLVFCDISHNNFEGTLPDFTSLPHLRYLSIGNNYFAANDFSAQFNDYLNLQSSWNNNYYYSPQKTKDSGGAQNGHVGDNITLTATNNSSSRISSRSSQAADTYQWFKDNVPINGATSSSYTITNAQVSDSGTYHCEIYNTDVPDLIVLRPSIALNIGVLGIDDNELNNINIYPNPARDVINIKVNANSFGSASLFDIRGRVILNKDLSSQISTINISNLNTGIYLLKFKTKDGLITKKIIKK